MPTDPLPLKDIHPPETIGWWPPAPGWWLLAIIIPVAIYLIFRLYKRVSRKTALKTARKLIKAIKRDETADDQKRLSDLSILMRRIAISTAPRAEAAGLVGQTWLAYLDASVKGKPFSEGIGRYLLDAPYRKSPPGDFDINKLISLCEDWLNAQRKRK